MRLGRVTPLPLIDTVANAVSVIVAGVIVLVVVRETGGILVGCALIGYGVCQLLQRPQNAAPVAASGSAPPPGHDYPVYAGQRRERITRERRMERITRERHWPVAS